MELDLADVRPSVVSALTVTLMVVVTLVALRLLLSTQVGGWPVFAQIKSVIDLV